MRKSRVNDGTNGTLPAIVTTRVGAHQVLSFLFARLFSCRLFGRRGFSSHTIAKETSCHLRTLPPFTALGIELSRPNQFPTLLVRRLRIVVCRARLSRIWFMMPLKLSTSGRSKSKGSDCRSIRLVLVGRPPVRSPGVMAAVLNILVPGRLAPGLEGSPGVNMVVPGRLGPGSPKNGYFDSRGAGKGE